MAIDAGYVELLLLGQTVNSYRDPEDRSIKFAHLLARVASLPGIRRYDSRHRIHANSTTKQWPSSIGFRVSAIRSTCRFKVVLARCSAGCGGNIHVKGTWEL